MQKERVAYNFMFLSVPVVIALLFGAVFWIIQARPVGLARGIRGDLISITKVLQQIDGQCAITRIHSRKIHIDFLNVKSFSGSEVGNMNLGYPKKWQGPYLNDNPSLGSNIVYDLIKFKEGYGVVPGFGSVMPNGQTLGQDFKVIPGMAFKKLVSDGGPLFYKGIALGMLITFSIGDYDLDGEVSEPADFSDANKVLEEFNRSMTFSLNEKVEEISV